MFLVFKYFVVINPVSDFSSFNTKLFTKKGDVVPDPFGGSGSTAIAPMKLNRDFVLIDLEQEYVDVANQRIKNVFAKEGYSLF